MFPDLVRARFKDAELPWQRTILLLALLLAAVRKLTVWLGTEALQFEFLFLAAPDGGSLDQEKELVQVLFQEYLANGTARIQQAPMADLVVQVQGTRWRGLCHYLLISTQPQQFSVAGMEASRLLVDGASAVLTTGDQGFAFVVTEDALDSWSASLETLLRRWIAS